MPGWESGGGKAYDTRNLTFKSNYVHDNGGNGLWADTNNINTTFDDNTVSNNWGAGIYDEISFNATIINNTITRQRDAVVARRGQSAGLGMGCRYPASPVGSAERFRTTDHLW